MIFSRKGTLISCETNYLELDGRSVHAEYGAIKRLHNKIRANKIKSNSCKRAIMLVVRITRRGELTMSKPCSMCHSNIKECTYIHRVIYSSGSVPYEEFTVRRNQA